MSNIPKNNSFLLKGLDINELAEWCASIGEPKYRSEQIYQWMYKFGSNDPFEMTNLSDVLKVYLSENVIFKTLELEKKNESNNEKTHKYLFKTNDNKFIETVSMVSGNRHTVCLSSQIRCNVGCTFCATGAMGIIRNLNVGEIVDQLSYVRAHVKNPITNVVFMGMGEPFLNYHCVLKAADIFHNQKGFGLAAQRITISTAGILPKIKRFFNEAHRYKLAISLNATNNKLRDKIMPINKKWPIEELINIAQEYSKKQNIVMFEYVLLDGINDSVSDAKKLADLLSGINCKLNIIPYNETDDQFKRPSIEKIDLFLKVLADNQKGFRIMVRWSKGQDIDAGCGQLATKVYD